MQLGAEDGRHHLHEPSLVGGQPGDRRGQLDEPQHPRTSGDVDDHQRAGVPREHGHGPAELGFEVGVVAQDAAALVEHLPGHRAADVDDARRRHVVAVDHGAGVEVVGVVLDHGDHAAVGVQGVHHELEHGVQHLPARRSVDPLVHLGDHRVVAGLTLDGVDVGLSGWAVSDCPPVSYQPLPEADRPEKTEGRRGDRPLGRTGSSTSCTDSAPAGSSPRTTT